MTCLVTCFSWKHKSFVTAWSFGKAEDSHFNMFFYMLFYLFHPSFVKCSHFCFPVVNSLAIGGSFGTRPPTQSRATWENSENLLFKGPKVRDDMWRSWWHFDAFCTYTAREQTPGGSLFSSLRVTWLTSHLYLIVLQMSSQMSFYDHLKCNLSPGSREWNCWPLPPRLSAL